MGVVEFSSSKIGGNSPGLDFILIQPLLLKGDYTRNKLNILNEIVIIPKVLESWSPGKSTFSVENRGR